MASCCNDQIPYNPIVQPTQVLSTVKILCDSNGTPFLRFYDLSRSPIFTKDYTIKGVEIDTVEDCDTCGSDTAPRIDAEQKILCDNLPSGEIVRFFRHTFYLESTVDAVVDTLLDGITPYTIQGDIDFCPVVEQEEPCNLVVDGYHIESTSSTHTVNFTAPVSSVSIANCSDCILKITVGTSEALQGNNCHFIPSFGSNDIMLKDECLIDSLEIENIKGQDFEAVVNGLRS